MDTEVSQPFVLKKPKSKPPKKFWLYYPLFSIPVLILFLITIYLSFQNGTSGTRRAGLENYTTLFQRYCPTQTCPTCPPAECHSAANSPPRNNNNRNKYYSHNCECRFVRQKAGCFQQITFFMRDYEAILCNSLDWNANLTLRNRNLHNSLVFYNQTQLRQVFGLLDQCFGSGLPCTAYNAAANYNMKEAPISDTCRFHISIPKTLTLCFAKDRFLHEGFINETILSPTDIVFLYQITKFWVPSQKL